MDASRVMVESEEGFSEAERQGYIGVMGLSLADIDDSQDWSWIDSDRDEFDYTDDMMMGVDA